MKVMQTLLYKMCRTNSNPNVLEMLTVSESRDQAQNGSSLFSDQTEFCFVDPE
jgi:hypothetical protein